MPEVEHIAQTYDTPPVIDTVRDVAEQQADTVATDPEPLPEITLPVHELAAEPPTYDDMAELEIAQRYSLPQEEIIETFESRAAAFADDIELPPVAPAAATEVAVYIRQESLPMPIVPEALESTDIPAAVPAIEVTVPEQTAAPALADVELRATETADTSEPVAEQHDTMFSAEEIQTVFDELAALLQPEQAAETEDPEAVPLAQETAEPTVVIELAETPPDSFAEFIAVEETVEPPATIEEIQATAPDQALETTFAQLAAYLQESKTEDEATMHPVIAQIQELYQVLFPEQEDPASDVAIAQLTPEVVEKLLVLVQTLGYENPRQTIADCVQDHDIEFLVYTVRYLYHLANEDNQQEFLLGSLPASRAREHKSLMGRIGKAIISLLTQPELQPE